MPLLDDRELGDVLSAMLRASRINVPPLADVLASCAAARSAHFLALCVAYVQLRGMSAGSALPSALADGKWLPQVCLSCADSAVAVLCMSTVGSPYGGLTPRRAHPTAGSPRDTCAHAAAKGAASAGVGWHRVGSGVHSRAECHTVGEPAETRGIVHGGEWMA